MRPPTTRRLLELFFTNAFGLPGFTGFSDQPDFVIGQHALARRVGRWPLDTSIGLGWPWGSLLDLIAHLKNTFATR
jgi:hypothetical protein